MDKDIIVLVNNIKYISHNINEMSTGALDTNIGQNPLLMTDSFFLHKPQDSSIYPSCVPF
jgi:hypothetical protein